MKHTTKKRRVEVLAGARSDLLLHMVVVKSWKTEKYKSFEDIKQVPLPIFSLGGCANCSHMNIKG